MSISQWIKRAAISLISKDDGQFSVAQITYNNKTGDCELVFPYGFCANPPLDSLVLMFNVLGQEENRAGIASMPQDRFKNLKSGEVVVGNYVTGSYAKFNEDGSVTHYSKDGDMNVNVDKNLNVTVKGNVTVNMQSGDMTINATGHNVNLVGATLNVNGTTVDASGIARLGGAGGGSQHIARIGDQVTCPAGIGTITSGGSHYAT